MNRRVVAALFVVTTIAAQPACRSAVHVPAQALDPGPGIDRLLLEAMDPFLLADELERSLVVEIDWVEGAEPSDAALDRFEALLRRYGPAGRSIRLLIDDPIPADELASAHGRIGLRRLVARHLDASEEPDPRRELVYLLYLPRSEPFFGESLPAIHDTIRFDRDGEIRSVRTILLFHEAIRDEALLWITPQKIEATMLVHEWGHVLGLVSNPDHAKRDDPTHCTEPGCVLNQAGPASTLHNAPAALFSGRLPDDFCRRCREDIARVRALWSERARRDPEFAETLELERAAAERQALMRWLEQQRETPGAELRLESP